MMNLLNADLNLVVALNALLEEQNVTRAGQRIGIGQPAMSAQLRRLRIHFDDELLCRVGKRYELTPLAREIKDEVAEALQLLEHTFVDRRPFDPETSDRRFTIVTSDYGMKVVGPALMRRLSALAPRVQVYFRLVRPDTLPHAADVLRTADFLLMPRECQVALPSITLFQDRWVCVTGRPRPGQALTLADLAQAEWARLYGAPDGRVIAADAYLGRFAATVRTAVIVDTFFMLPFAVTGTDRLALLQERIALPMRDMVDIAILNLPVALPPLVEAAWWHPSRESDRGHAWMRDQLREVARGLESVDQRGIAGAAGPWETESTPHTRTALPV